jgi:hypothetical protein
LLVGDALYFAEGIDGGFADFFDASEGVQEFFLSGIANARDLIQDRDSLFFGSDVPVKVDDGIVGLIADLAEEQ